MSVNKEKFVEAALRIAGCWTGREALAARLPPDYRLTERHLHLPDGTQLECQLRPADRQFATVFRTACRRTASTRELKIIDGYRFNCCLIGRAGSLAGARTMLQAGSAIVRAGGGGVFIDNGCIAHGAKDWLEMADDDGPDAISFAFVNIVQGSQEAWTTGMHVLGLPDLTIRSTRAKPEQEALTDTLRFMAEGYGELGDGHFLANDRGRTYRIRRADPDQFATTSHLHNPFGRLKLETCQPAPSAADW